MHVSEKDQRTTEERKKKLRAEYLCLKMNFQNVLKQILVLLWIYTICFNGVFADAQLGDPYRILGIERKASTQEIRQAYKKLAKKWCVQTVEFEMKFLSDFISNDDMK